MTEPQKVITRLPPSPTGFTTVGTVKTALLNYLFTKKNGGKIILRFEDTDKVRSKKEYERDIFEQLEWLGFSFDGIYHQSERTLVYQKYLNKLIDSGAAYYSEASRMAEAQSESEDVEEGEPDSNENSPRVIRLKNPNKVVTFNDLIRGEISIDTTELGDFVIARSIEEPLYNLAVVLDDYEMGMTHIIRGEDGIYNTPRQILIQEALGFPTPVYCHFPFLLGTDRSKLSKRNGSIPVNQYRKDGYLPQALLNYIALLGWNPGDEREVFTLQELIEAFDLTKIQKAGAIFDVEKLKWFNREHIKKLSDSDFLKLCKEWLPENITKLPQWSDDKLTKLAPHIKEKTTILRDIIDMANTGDLNYFFDTPIYAGDLLIPKSKDNEEIKKETIVGHLKFALETLKTLSENKELEWSTEKIKESLWQYATDNGRAVVLSPLRIALSGKEKSSDPFTIAFVIGFAETEKRINAAIETLSA